MKSLARLCVLIVAIVTLFSKTVLSVSLGDDIENLIKKAEQVTGKSIKEVVNDVEKAFDLINDIESATGVEFVNLTEAVSKDPKYFGDNVQEAVLNATQDAGKVARGEAKHIAHDVEHAVQDGGKMGHEVADYIPAGENYESMVKKAEKAAGKKLKDIFQQGAEVSQLVDQVEKATGKKIDKVYEDYMKYNENLGDDVQKPVVRVKAELNAERPKWIKKLVAAKKRIINSSARTSKNVYGAGFNAFDRISNATAALVQSPLRNRDAIGMVNHANNLRQEASNKVRSVADGFMDGLASAKKKIVDFKGGIASNIWTASSNAASDVNKGAKNFAKNLFASMESDEEIIS